MSCTIGFVNLLFATPPILLWQHEGRQKGWYIRKQNLTIQVIWSPSTIGTTALKRIATTQLDTFSDLAVLYGLFMLLCTVSLYALTFFFHVLRSFAFCMSSIRIRDSIPLLHFESAWRPILTS